MYSSYLDKKKYTRRIEKLKRDNIEQLTKSGGGRIFGRRWRKQQMHRIRRLIRRMGKPLPNYFSDERIAVYTVIYGSYDKLLEPMCCPDNCDFYLISDHIEPPKESAWKKYDISPETAEKISGMNDIQRNRYMKMLPQLLFPDYRYSVYLDGNIQLVTDPTEFINHMPGYGISLHRHVSRDCVYDEAEAILEQNKAPQKVMKELVRFLKKEGMPEHYGLLECPVIVRDHKNKDLVELMEAWWEMFEIYPYRDQMLLPYLLYKRGISVDEVAWLGNNVRKCPSFRRYKHL